MKWFNNLKIGVRLIASFLIIAAIAGIIGGVGIYNLQKTNTDYSVNYTDTVELMNYMEEVSSNFQRVRMNLYAVVLSNNIVDKEYYISMLDQRWAVIDENMANYKAILDRYKAESSVYLEELQSKLDIFKDETEGFISGLAMDSSRQQEAFDQLRGDIRDTSLQVDEDIQLLLDYNLSYAEGTIDRISSGTKTATLIMVVVAVFGMGLAVFIGIYISRSVAKPIHILVQAANKLALGDVNVQVASTSTDETGALMDAFSKMVSNIRDQALIAEQIALGDLTVDVNIRSEEDLLGKRLQEMVDQNNMVFSGISSAAEQVNSGAMQISSASQSLAQGSGEQASSIEQISASIEELAAQTKHNADTSNIASDMSATSKQHAERGYEQMQEMVHAMAAINESSNNISNIIKVIDDIAFQTNILALNAAVEAAHAGQQGRGFAVVAEEVRNLAARSAQAAKETTDLIEDSIKRVELGTGIANETVHALNQIKEAATQSTQLVQEIATASNEQVIGIDQINMAIQQVAQVVHTNSSASEETASISEELSAQAEELKAAVAQVKLKSELSGVSGIINLGSFGQLPGDNGSSRNKSETNNFLVDGFSTDQSGYGKY